MHPCIQLEHHFVLLRTLVLLLNIVWCVSRRTDACLACTDELARLLWQSDAGVRCYFAPAQVCCHVLHVIVGILLLEEAASSFSGCELT
jgi:hypothetical protein